MGSNISVNYGEKGKDYDGVLLHWLAKDWESSITVVAMYIKEAVNE